MTLVWPLVVLTLVQLGFWTLLYSGYRRVAAGKSSLGRTEPIDDPELLPQISVVVAARNEEDRLPGLIAAFDLQTHHDFEVVVVDDASEDGTAICVLEKAESRSWLRLVAIEEPRFPRKKNALTLGVGAARYGLLAFTDADCRPGPLWLERIARRHAQFDDNVLLVGFAPFTPEKGWVSRLARYDAILNGFLAAASIGIGFPYMATGRNLSYPEALFEEAGGHSHGNESLSGDDDLFLQHVWSRRLARIVWSSDPDTFVFSRPKASVASWLKQKRRHSSAGRYMKISVQIWSGLFVLSLVAVWLAPFLIGSAGVGLLMIWLAAHYLAVRRSVRDLTGADLLPWFPVLTLLMVVYYAVFPIFGFLFPTKEWG